MILEWLNSCSQVTGLHQRDTAIVTISAILQRLLLLGVAGALAAAGGELTVRLVKPGFPGFKLPQVAHRPVPGLGFEMVPNQAAFTAAERVTINEHGLRGPSISRADDGTALRVLCLGDSMTFGYGVADELPFPRQLERLLSTMVPDRDAQVINAGVQRYFTHQEIDYLRLRGVHFGPSAVVLAIYSNDLGVRPASNWTSEYEKEREQAAGAFRNRFPWLYTIIKNSALVEIAKLSYLGIGSSDAPLRIFEGRASGRDEERWTSMDDDLGTFARLSREHGFVPLIVTLPARVQIQKSFPKSLYPKRVIELAQRHGLTAVSVERDFHESLARGADPYLPWDNHLSAKGHALVAAAIAEQLRRLLVVETAARRSE